MKLVTSFPQILRNLVNNIYSKQTRINDIALKE